VTVTAQRGCIILPCVKADVVVTDAGYKLGASVQQGLAQGAYGVHRFSPHQVRLEREDGQKIDLKRLVKHQKYGTDIWR